MGWGLTVPRGGPKHGRSLADLYPAQAVEWHPALNDGLKPTDVSPGNNGKVWWMCGRCGSPWQASINNRTVKHSINCVECNRGRKRRIQDQAQDAPPDAVATSAPALATEWHPEKNGPSPPSRRPLLGTRTSGGAARSARMSGHSRRGFAQETATEVAPNAQLLRSRQPKRSRRMNCHWPIPTQA
jgi:hypothetical protein